MFLAYASITFIRKDPTLNEEQKKKAIEKIAIRHHSLTGDWEFQDMQDWDRVDVLEMNQALETIGKKKQASKEMD